MATALSGSLSAFGLPDVLRLLGLGSRSACVQLRSDGRAGEVRLVSGLVSAATADAGRADLLRRVVVLMRVDAVDLAAALTSPEPVAALVGSGVVDATAAQQLAVEQCVDALGELASWDHGTFEVDLRDDDPGDLGVRLPVAELVAAAGERQAEWDRVRAALPDPAAVLALVPDPGAVPPLDHDDWALLARVDGRRRLADVLEATGAGQLDVHDRLARLVELGVVAVRLPGADDERAQVAALLDGFEGTSRPAEPAPAPPAAEAPSVPVVVADEPPPRVPARSVPMDALPPVDEVRLAVAQALGLDAAPMGLSMPIPPVLPQEPLPMLPRSEEQVARPESRPESRPVPVYGSGQVGTKVRTRPAPIPVHADDSALLPGPREVPGSPPDPRMPVDGLPGEAQVGSEGIRAEDAAQSTGSTLEADTSAADAAALDDGLIAHLIAGVRGL